MLKSQNWYLEKNLEYMVGPFCLWTWLTCFVGCTCYSCFLQTFIIRKSFLFLNYFGDPVCHVLSYISWCWTFSCFLLSYCWCFQAWGLLQLSSLSKSNWRIKNLYSSFILQFSQWPFSSHWAQLLPISFYFRKSHWRFVLPSLIPLVKMLLLKF